MRLFDVPHHSLWEWATDLINDPQLAPHFHWDAEKVFWYNDKLSTHVFHEPWTTDTFWNVQVRVCDYYVLHLLTRRIIYLNQSEIPEGGNPLCFILYANKTKLSSFSTTKGYPVIVHCVNHPTVIQNGNGFGGGHVVGWLPVVRFHFFIPWSIWTFIEIAEDPKKEKKKAFIDFKCAIWHSSFHLVLQSIIEYSKTGYWFKCGNHIQCWLFPIVLILSADYKEQ